jgi:hypothetical protein
MVGDEHGMKMAQINTGHIKWGKNSQERAEGRTEVSCHAVWLFGPFNSATTGSESGLPVIVVDCVIKVWVGNEHSMKTARSNTGNIKWGT